MRHELEALAAGRLDVGPATGDIQLLKQATAPNSEATGFFTLVSALVGLLLAFNAMLLSAPERRRVIADLRIQGTRTRDLISLLVFQSLCLGLVASIVGVLCGDLLSRSLFHETPGYLAAAFPLGTQTVIGWQPVVLSLAGGVFAACLAAAPPLLDLRRSRAVDGVYFERGEPGQAVAMPVRVWLCVGAAVLVLASRGALLVFGPSAAIVAIVALAISTLLAIPFCFAMVMWCAQTLAARRHRLNMLVAATRALRATTVRSLALASTAAIAVFGSVAAQGAHQDLLTGLYGDYAQYVSTAAIWVTNPGDELATDSFPARTVQARISRLPGVISVRPYQGGFLDVQGRRVWVIARSAAAPTMFPESQVVDGDPVLATARVRRGGWVTASQQIAQAARVKVGQALTLPTPTGPVSYHLAATTTNLGWAAGAIVINDADYRRAWAATDPTALEIDVARPARTTAIVRAVQGVVARDAGLRVQTSVARAAQADQLAREGLGRLTQISALLMVAAALAMASAMSAAIWQRRRSLASLRIQSFRPGQLRMVLVWESVLVLGTGCVVGGLAGVYGHELIDHYLRLVTGFPAPFSPATAQTLETTLAIMFAALCVLAIPGYAASEVAPSMALQE